MQVALGGLIIIVPFEIKLHRKMESEMKTLILVLILPTFALAGCKGWTTLHPIIYNRPTSPASRTPVIHTATPFILSPPFTATSTPAFDTPGQGGHTLTPTTEPTFTETPATPTLTPSIQTVPPLTVEVDILGCDTNLDITHGMGEVTNAYVTLRNVGAADVLDICATLRGRDEGRPHPDKIKCLASLPAKHQVNLKLTIDTTYKEATPIQIDVTTNNVLLVRAGQDSCTDIGLIAPAINDLGTMEPVLQP